MLKICTQNQQNRVFLFALECMYSSDTFIAPFFQFHSHRGFGPDPRYQFVLDCILYLAKGGDNVDPKRIFTRIEKMSQKVHNKSGLFWNLLFPQHLPTNIDPRTVEMN